ncbi:MAG: SRPBCC family protein [Burkholderiales bacterium]
MDVDVWTPEFPRTSALAPKQTARWQVERGIAVRVSSKFVALPERVFDAWLDSRIAGNWLFATASRPMTRVTIDPRVGGSFRFADGSNGRAIAYTGRYLEIVRPRRLVFTLSIASESKAQTRVTTEIAPRDEGCELTLTHESVPRDQAHRIEGRWAGILYGLGVTLDQLSAGAGTRLP